MGSAEFFAGIDKLECKIKWNALYPDVLTTCAILLLQFQFKSEHRLKRTQVPEEFQKFLQLHMFQGHLKISAWNNQAGRQRRIRNDNVCNLRKTCCAGVDIFEIDVLEISTKLMEWIFYQHSSKY